MEITDTHAHLFWENFDTDLQEVINRAKKNKITKIYCPNIDSTTKNKLLEISEKYPTTIFPLIGLHPGSIANKNIKNELELVENELKTGKYYGVGEIGIDLYWEENKKFKEQQIKAFKYQVKLAKKHQLPIIIHTRKAFNEIFNVIDTENDNSLRGIFHCFTGNITQAKKIINYGGFKLGIGGVVTYKTTKLHKTLPKIGLEHLVLETDAPFLPPEPHRGQRNEPAFIINSANKIAEIFNTNIETIAKITTKNAEEIFTKKTHS